MDDFGLLAASWSNLASHVVGKGEGVLRVLVLGVERLDTVDEDHVLVPTKHRYELLGPVPIDLAFACNVVGHLGQNLLIEVYEMVERALADVQSAQRWQEVVADEEAEEDEVVDDSLQVEAHPHLGREGPVLEKEVLAQNRNMYQLQVRRTRYVDALHSSLLRLLDDVLFSDDQEVRLVRDQRKHDQVCVRAVEAVSRVGIVAWLLLEVSNEVHHFVLAFAGHARV